MSEEVQRSTGRPSNYKMDRGGVPAEFGPFLGVVKNNVDPTRAGRLQVYIETFADGDPEDPTKWTTVRYLPGFFGYTQPDSQAATGDGVYTQNQNSYGMWFTPPDIGITVMCVFANGDRQLGYYIGVVPDVGIGHMVPAIGGSNKYVLNNDNQRAYFENAPLLPVTEINTNNTSKVNSRVFYDEGKPVQAVVAGALFQQGLVKDPERGPIRSSSQRETPSAVFGISTPGQPVYQGGMDPKTIRQQIKNGEISPDQAQVIARQGGHTFVMDDGDLEGNNALFRLRTPKGHQITMNDSGNFFYITHANGQTWLEFGVEGTVDVFSTNSVNIRTQGDINFHADRDINMYAAGNIQVRSGKLTSFEAETTFSITAQQDLTLYSKATLGVKADGTMAVQSAGGTWQGGEYLQFTAGGIDLNGPTAPEVTEPTPIATIELDDTEFDTSKGWQVVDKGLKTIVPRAPTHEPYPYHNKGVDVKVKLEPGKPTPPPGAAPVPAGWNVTAR